jgi:hypothetical protein
MLQWLKAVNSKYKHIKHLPRNRVAELFGWMGSVGILLAYALLSFGLLDGNSPIYHVIFLIGSSGLAVVTYRHRAYQSLVVNIFFAILAFVALVRIGFIA